jgi:hypothetical protein
MQRHAQGENIEAAGCPVRHVDSRFHGVARSCTTGPESGRSVTRR